MRVAVGGAGAEDDRCVFTVDWHEGQWAARERHQRLLDEAAQWRLARAAGQSAADMALYDIDARNYGTLVLDQDTWELAIGLNVEELPVARETPPAIPTPAPSPEPEVMEPANRAPAA